MSRSSIETFDTVMDVFELQTKDNLPWLGQGTIIS